MGAITPEKNANKGKVLSAADKDGYRGVYMPWGDIYYESMALGFVAGALFVCAAWLFSLIA